MKLFSGMAQRQQEYFQGMLSSTRPLFQEKNTNHFIQIRPDGIMGDDYLNTMCIIRDEAGEKRWADLKARVVEHNIRSVRFIQHTSTYPTAQDDGPVLHKDPSWPHGDFAGAHRGRN